MNEIQKKVLKWEYKINFFMIFVIFVSLLIASAFINSYVKASVEKEIINNLKNVAYIVAYDTKINDVLADKNLKEEVSSITERIRKNADGVEYIIVIDMNGIIYAHPDRKLIGTVYREETGENVFSKIPHKYSSTDRTKDTVKYFMPAMSDGVQIGVVITGTFSTSIKSTLSKINTVITLFIIMGLLIGTIIAIGLFGVESREYSAVLDQRSAILFAIKDGIIAINKDGVVNTINDGAKKIFSLTDKDLYKNIEDVLPQCNLLSALNDCDVDYDVEQNYNGKVLITNCVPIKNTKGETIGAVATFKDKTELNMLNQELTGIRSMVDSLRAYSHEFMNRLHVILGLMQLESYDEAKKYILQVTKQQQQILSNVMNKILDTTTAGLLIGKASRSKEMGVDFILDENSHIGNFTGVLTEEFTVVVIGNLIDNALEAAEIREDGGEKTVRVYLKEEEDKIIIEVSDTGVGIEDDMKEKVFVKGVSSKHSNNYKPGARGIGSSSVKKNIDRVGGTIEIQSVVGKGSKFRVVVPKKRRR